MSDVEICFVFFFQAEDGIRDRDVTGVQTCALPIWSWEGYFQFYLLWPWKTFLCCVQQVLKVVHCLAQLVRATEDRSEERRVGKECRTRWLAFHGKKKNRFAVLVTMVRNVECSIAVR